MANDYANQSMQQLVGECIRRGMLVTPEMVEDKAKLVALLSGGERVYTVKVLKNYVKAPRKRTVQDFVKYFNQRYRVLSAILKSRKELESVVSIARIVGKKERETVALVGMVMGKRETKSGYTVITLEDPTGSVEVWVSAKNMPPDKAAALAGATKEVVLDEVIGIVGQTSSGNRVFANAILFPDVPLTKELKKGVRDTHVVFVGDVEIGSKLFMRNEFEQFVMWLSGKLGNEEQRALAAKVGYVVFIGDLVHGVGVYPGQQDDSDIHDIKEQYAQFTRYVKMIPEHIQVMTITGNHDAGRLQEPQLPVYRDFAEELYALPNVTMLSNPSSVTIEETPGHPGFDLLLYHGYSLVYYAKEVQPIKDAGGMKAMGEVMKLLLRKRHLAPTHGCNTYVPDAEEDPMVIDKIPDFLVTGHVHNIAYGTYNGVTVINAGCWNDVSDEQVKRGLEPEPARLPVVNLKTREVRLVNFYPQKKAKETIATREAQG